MVGHKYMEIMAAKINFVTFLYYFILLLFANGTLPFIVLIKAVVF
jgi:hypothetical protein